MAKNISSIADFVDDEELKGRYREILSSLETDQVKNAKSIAALKRKLDEDGSREAFKREKENDEIRHRINAEYAKEEGKILVQATEEIKANLEKGTEALKSTMTNYAKEFISEIDSTINTYVDKIQLISGGLIGYNGTSTLYALTDQLQNALSTSALVKQQDVYTNLTNLVSSGIVKDLAQRSYLETLSKNIGLEFNGSDAILNRLIQVYGSSMADDMTASRIAIEYNLKAFLNSTYEISDYIKDMFKTVSDSIYEMQALAGYNQGVGLESTIQTWLGSYYSAGVSSSTITNLAKALNELGSGDISNVGSGIANLILMGAARSNNNYGELMQNGLTSNDVNEIMNSVTDYLIEMGADSNNNVIRSQLSKLFGVNVADLVAARGVSTGSLGVSSNISTMLSQYGELVPTVTKISNVLDNMKYTIATNIASSPLELITYETTKLISSIGSTIVRPFSETAANLLELTPLLPIFGATIQAIAGDNMLSNLFNGTTHSAVNMYNALDSLSFKTSKAGVSESMAITTNGDTNALVEGTNSSLNDNLTTLGITPDEVTLEDNVSTITSTVTEIYDLLLTEITGLAASLKDVTSGSNDISYSSSKNTGIGL